MAEAQQEVQLGITQDNKEGNSTELTSANHEPTIHHRRNYKLWFRIATYIFFALSGQSTATLLGRFYFEKGGKSKWVGALVQLAGFPILLPFYFFVSSKISPTPSTAAAAACPIQYSKPTSLLTTLALVYVTLGLLVAGICFLTSFGLQYLPVSTFSLICASQLGFTALFSFFLNSQKFTSFVINSIVLLTISSILLVFNTDSSSVLVSKAKYKVGFICTIGAAAGNGLALALTQFAFTKIIKKQTFRAVVDLIIYESLIATCATLVGLFASGEWKGLNLEMDEFQTGKGSYVLTLAWTMISWQVFAIGAVGLIFEVSSLFCNVTIALGLPVVQVLAVIVFHDGMHGLKIVAIVLALWGFISYVYQQYLDDHCKSFESSENENACRGSIDEGDHIEGHCWP